MKPPQQHAKQADVDALVASINVLKLRLDKSEKNSSDLNLRLDKSEKNSSDLERRLDESEETSKETKKKLNTLLADFRKTQCHRAEIIASQALLHFLGEQPRFVPSS